MEQNKRTACPECGKGTVDSRPTDDYSRYCPSCKWTGDLDDPSDLLGDSYSIRIDVTRPAVNRALLALHREVANIEGNVVLARRDLDKASGGRQRKQAASVLQEAPYKLAPLTEMQNVLRTILQEMDEIDKEYERG